MSTTGTLPQELDQLALAFHCASCGGRMLPTRTHAGEKSLTCVRCSHEVCWSTRFVSCKVAEQVAR